MCHVKTPTSLLDGPLNSALVGCACKANTANRRRRHCRMKRQRGIVVIEREKNVCPEGRASGGVGNDSDQRVVLPEN